MSEKVLGLSRKQRSDRARYYYTTEVHKFWEKLKKDYGVDDETLDNAITDQWNEIANFSDMWEEKLSLLQLETEKKYNVWIEHDEDDVRITTWAEKEAKKK